MNRAPHEVLAQLVVPSSQVDGIFVVGMFGSGTDLLGAALSVLGLRRIDNGAEGAHPSALAAFNQQLLSAADGSTDDGPPEAAPLELARTLAGWADEAQEKVEAALVAAASGAPARPWVWDDPRLSFLAPFWADALGVRPAVILVHRSPDRLAQTALPKPRGGEAAITLWDRYNRSALVLCSEYPSLAVPYDDVVGRPKALLDEIAEFLGGLGVVVDGDLGQAATLIEQTAPGRDDEGTVSAVGPRQHTLDRLLHELDGRGAGAVVDARDLVDVTAEFYDADYYGTTYDRSGVPYSRNEALWVELFDRIGGSIVKTLQPASALDVGCAVGLLVEALRVRGVDARGIDISSWAIGQVPPALRPFCRVGSITDEIDGHYDLITCTEVLEHLPPSLVEASVGNLCRHADMVLFSSTPDDFDEPTHLNVEPVSYWAQRFLRHGFVHDVDYDATFLAPHAMLFRRGDTGAERLVEDYESALWRSSASLERARSESRRLRDEHNELIVREEAVAGAREELRQDVLRLAEERDNAVRRRNAENLAAFQTVRRFEADQRRLAALVDQRENELTAVYDTRIFRYTASLRKLYGRLRGREVLVGPAPAPVPDAIRPADGSYEIWIELFDTLDDEGRRRLEARLQALSNRPRISVLMPVYNPPPDLLRGAIESVRDQIYPEWELCIADDCSTDPTVVRVLDDYAASDPRIKVVRRAENGHISAASNTALSLASGRWVALLDHDDLLAPHALALVALELAEHPEAALVYSDEDKIDEAGRRRDPFFKPDFDPLLLTGQNFVSHLSVFRKDLVDTAGGYREGYEGSQDWDLTLRVSERVPAAQVRHIPHVLYHWRVHASSTAALVSAKPYAVDAGRRAVNDHLERTGRPGQVTRIGKSGHNRVAWALPDPAPRVSIVVPTRDGRLLQRCIDSVLAFTQYPDFEMVVVDNSSESLPTLQYLQSYDERLKVLRDERPFNYAELNNAAVQHTTGDVVCLLNDDTEVISGEWLTEMVSQVLQPGVGAVGAKLYYDEARIQHAGVVLGVYGVAGHAFRMFDRLSPGYFGNLQLAHRMSAVTAACAVLRREAWDAIGGFDEKNLPVAFNDIDFCLRLREAGWEIVWTPYAELYHHESTSRGLDTAGPRAAAFAREVAYMETRWGFNGLRCDPYYNPNLSLDAENYTLAWPPRVPLVPDPPG